jgi:hypothetical protein
VREAKELTRTDTRVIAERWVERHIAPGTHIAADPSTPRFAGLKVLALSLPGPKRPFDENRSIERLQSQGVKDVVVTGAITDRVLAARSDYPRESRFYDQLRTRAKRVYYLRPGDDHAGPWVAVYRLPA